MDGHKRRGELGKKIFLQLREKILEDEYPRGTKLKEVALAKEMNISRTPVREALKQLELEGLAKSEPNKGVSVIGFSKKDVEDMLEIRRVLEALAIKLAIDRLEPIDIRNMEEAYKMMIQAANENSFELYTKSNLLFHESIYKATKSQYFMRLLTDINYYIHVTSSRSIRTHNRMNTALIEHRQILDSIILKDKDLAQRRIIEHIDAVKDILDK